MTRARYRLRTGRGGREFYREVDTTTGTPAEPARAVLRRERTVLG